MSSASELQEATVAVAVSADGRSSRAIRWAAENLLPYAHRVLLLHVIPSVSSIPTPSGRCTPVQEMEKGVVDMYLHDLKEKAEEVFWPFRKLCRTKNVETLVLDGENTAAELLNYISDSGIKNLVLGSASVRCFTRTLRGPDVPAVIIRSAPSSCNIFVVSRWKLTLKFADQLVLGGASFNIHTKTISRKVFSQAKRNIIFDNQSSSKNSDFHEILLPPPGTCKRSLKLNACGVQVENNDDKRNILHKWEKYETSKKDALYIALPSADDVKTQPEVVQLKLGLQKTLAMYNKTCEDLTHAKQKVELLADNFSAEAKNVKGALERQDMLIRVAAEERAKHLEATKEVKEAKQLLARESRRHKTENFARKLSLEKPNVLNALFSNNKRFRRYSSHEIESATKNFSDAMKIGEGACGYVYKCTLDHIPVAVKVIHKDASHKKQEFLREVEVLSQLHHPHLVSLLGVCPESGCLVYEYMENGSLEDQLFNRENSSPLPCFIRFRIIYEVARALAFLHGNRPDPIVHRDLKPGNILLDKNYVSKVGDVGLAKLISDIVPDGITEYRETIIAGTLYYMDPEYQRTGTIRPKSDLYALGIIALQLLTSMQTRGLVMHVENAIKNGTFSDILDKSVSDWPLVEAENLAKIALKCSRLKCRDRPDLETEVLPELEELMNTANICFKLKQHNVCPPSHYLCPILQEVMDDPYIAADGYTYELRAIRAWLGRHEISPVTRLRLPHTKIIPNRSLRTAIQEWRSRMSFLIS